MYVCSREMHVDLGPTTPIIQPCPLLDILSVAIATVPVMDQVSSRCEEVKDWTCSEMAARCDWRTVRKMSSLWVYYLHPLSNWNWLGFSLFSPVLLTLSLMLNVSTDISVILWTTADGVLSSLCSVMQVGSQLRFVFRVSEWVVFNAAF